MTDDTFRKALDSLDQGTARSAGAGAETPPPAGDIPPHPTVDALRARFAEAILRHEVVSGDEHIVYVEPARSKEILAWLRDDPESRYDLLKDLTAIDYGNGVFLQVLYELWSIENRRQLRVKVDLPLDRLEVESVYYVWRAADWMEREVYDMFGIVFNGHPDLRRILMPYNYAEGHPLRKDFPLRGRFTRAEQTRLSLSMKTEDHYSPYELQMAARLGQKLPDPFNQEEVVEEQGALGGMGGGG